MVESTKNAIFSRAESLQQSSEDNEGQGNIRGSNGDEHASMPPRMFSMAVEPDPQNLPGLNIDKCVNNNSIKIMN